MFHLAWFTNAQPHGWEQGRVATWAGDEVTEKVWQSGEFLQSMAQSLERAGFDYLMLEDHVTMAEPVGSMPRLDPTLVIPGIASATQHLGIVATVSTAFTHPYALARTFATLDHLTGGRVGWNVVTTSEKEAASVFGMKSMPPHDERYARAHEFVEIADRLWDSWDPGAIVVNETDHTYVDPERVHRVDYTGEYFTSSGYANFGRSPQARPVICQAGASPAGRDFGATHADTVLISTGGGNSTAMMREIRDDIRLRTEKAGRDPDSIKVMFMVTPILADTQEAADDIARLRLIPTPQKITSVLKMMSHISGHDMHALDLDEPLPARDFTTDGHQATFGNFIALSDGGRRTLREMIGRHDLTSVELVGTPASVAERMGEVMDEVGGDGFLFRQRPLTRRYITEITDGLVPELRRRGLVRTSYEFPTFRENLTAF